VSAEWTQRGDVREALILLSSGVPELTSEGRDGRWPSLTEAIHWLIDDTGWDLRDPNDDIPRILRTREEAAAVEALVRSIMNVHDRHGPTAPDAAWYGDPEWSCVQELAATTLTLLDG
jgi:hypothetical protein